MTLPGNDRAEAIAAMVQANCRRLSARTGAAVVASLAVPSLVMAALAVTTTGAAQAAVPDTWGFAFVDKPMVAGIPYLSHQAGIWPPPLHVHSAPGAPGQVLNSTVNGENAGAPPTAKQRTATNSLSRTGLTAVPGT